MHLFRVVRIAAGAALIAIAGGGTAAAQVVRGSVRDAKSSLPVIGATVTAVDSAGGVLGTAVSDTLGNYALKVRRLGAFDLKVRRLGFAMLVTKVPPRALSDTIEYEFLLDEVAAAAEAVTVTAQPSMNELRLKEARRRGWRVYEPELVAAHREQSQDLMQLMRSIGAAGVTMPRSRNDCMRSIRNQQCLTIVMDGQVLGPVAVVLPSDIYFLAILSASDARIQYGDRAPWGAIAIFTRSRQDRYVGRP